MVRQMAKKPETGELCLEHLTTDHYKSVFQSTPVAVQKHLTTDHLRQALKPQQNGQPAQSSTQQTSAKVTERKDGK